MTLLPQQNVLFIQPQQTRIVVVTITMVTTAIWIVTTTIIVVATTILICWSYINKPFCWEKILTSTITVVTTTILVCWSYIKKNVLLRKRGHFFPWKCTNIFQWVWSWLKGEAGLQISCSCNDKICWSSRPSWGNALITHRTCPFPHETEWWDT